MNVIKRNGIESKFEDKKIKSAIVKANMSIEELDRLSESQIIEITAKVTSKCKLLKRSVSVEEISDFIEEELMRYNAFKLSKAYITYRYDRALLRKSNSTDEQILSLIELQNEEVKQENSNKNPTIASTQRDYMAGEVSKDISKRFLLPEKIVKAHDEGIIHFHDMDYFAQHIHNCCLVNLEDMLQNGTVISGTLIEKPKSFYTACNIATQIVAQVASSQYGGQTISLTHLAPFVEISRIKIKEQVLKELVDIKDLLGESEFEDKVNKVVESRLKEEIKHGVQTIQYQVNTLQTCNGQTPFVSVNMYLNEAKDEKTKADLALIIEEVLKQRIVGTKNKDGVWVTPAFPKLLYVLEEDNVKEGSKYFYLTKLAAECTAKRMVPDYISEKKMLEYKIDKDGDGNCYPCINITVPNNSDVIRKLV